MTTMRDDQITDFNKEFLRYLRSEGELPREIREELQEATSVAIQSTPTTLVIHIVSKNGTQTAYRFSCGSSPDLVIMKAPDSTPSDYRNCNQIAGDNMLNFRPHLE